MSVNLILGRLQRDLDRMTAQRDELREELMLARALLAAVPTDLPVQGTIDRIERLLQNTE